MPTCRAFRWFAIASSGTPYIGKCPAKKRDIVSQSTAVRRLDRLGRLFEHLIETISKLNNRKIGFKNIQETIDTTTSGGKLIFRIFGALAEFERILSGRERMLDCKKQEPGDIISADRYKSKENPGFSSSQSVRNFSVPTGTPICMDDGDTTGVYIPL